MFLGHRIDVSGRLREGSEIAIRFASLAPFLQRRRPRPRWRTQLVVQQQLRWLRTTLLGRVPGWAPPVAPVGPYRPVVVEAQQHLRVLSADVRPTLRGRDGSCEARVRLEALDGRIEGATLCVGDVQAPLVCEPADDGTVTVAGSLVVPDAARWWPSTHGEPALYPVRLDVMVAGRTIAVDLGDTGFRSVELDREGGRFALKVNGVEVFCRGAVWTPLDVVGLGEPADALDSALRAARDAGMNMLRLSGVMSYATAAFHDACDRLGILVWQDFMFANMDYPGHDESFSLSVRAEASQVVDRLQLSPSLALLCGSTEIQQQVAMLGLTREHWSSPLYDELLPRVASAALPAVPYVSSTPSGGALPFRVDAGVSHYYGVGAYRRPIEDARRARVRFTAECLGFANVPCAQTVEELEADSPSQPAWKARVPRDRGTPWDFDDIRDHYVGRLFGVDPHELRMTDVARYLELGRLATGEAMAGAMAEWRRAGSECAGALVWFLRDLWPGAGWGVVDAHGRPKAAYYFLKRTLQPVALLSTDEGLNGLSFHVVNDSKGVLRAQLKLTLYRGEVSVVDAAAAVTVPPHSVTELSADIILGRFVDTTYAYRFGPPGHDIAVGVIEDADGAALSRTFHLVDPRPLRADPGLQAHAEPVEGGHWLVTAQTARFARAVAFDVRGYEPDDDFFHIEPGGRRHVLLRRLPGTSAPPSARLLPLNAHQPTRVVLRTSP